MGLHYKTLPSPQGLASSFPSEELGSSLVLGLCPDSLVSQIPGHWRLCQGVKCLGDSPWWAGPTFHAGLSGAAAAVAAVAAVEVAL